MTTAATIVALLLTAQGAGPPRDRIDPALIDAIRPLVQAAVEAELDPKRGPANAVAYLDNEIAKSGRDSPAQLGLRLRHAAIELRRRLMRNEKLPEPIRYEQSVATFARLDLTDPGLVEWLTTTLAHHDYANQKLSKKSQRVILATLLVGGPDLDKGRIKKRFADAISAIGYELRFVPAKQATMVLKVSAESAMSPDATRRAVKVVLGLESLREGKAIWRHSLFRTESAKDLDVAIDAALDWLVRIGGRDLFFRWLGERAFHSFLERGPISPATGTDLERDDHEGHGHAVPPGMKK